MISANSNNEDGEEV